MGIYPVVILFFENFKNTVHCSESDRLQQAYKVFKKGANDRLTFRPGKTDPFAIFSIYRGNAVYNVFTELS